MFFYEHIAVNRNIIKQMRQMCSSQMEAEGIYTYQAEFIINKLWIMVVNNVFPTLY